ncbi:MAG: hypothetical protein P8Y24_06440 [Gammaproteobacteria bacterium]
MTDITFNGMTMEYSVVEGRMDPELKAEVESTLESYDEQILLDAYMIAHEKKYGKAFLQA